VVTVNGAQVVLIEDVDVAQATAGLTRSTILAQSGATVLARSRILPEAALQLLS